MAILLYRLLFIVSYSVAKVAWKFYTIYRKLHDATRQFREFSSGQDASGYNSYSTTTSTGEVIEDRRTEDEINRKIFTQEEGEYVDFEEEK